MPQGPEQHERYEKVERLGEGGMGEVWLAHDNHLDRKVALKLISQHVPGMKPHVVRERFRREAVITARLEHPNVPTVYDVGVTNDGRMFVVMQFVPGRTLADELVVRRRLPLSWVAAIAAQISEVLGYAHGMGVVHRDLKPGNVMLTPGGVVKVLDFGIAAALEPASGEQPLTRGDFPIGTLGFIAPEQFLGQRATERSDLYALGCVLYQLVAGVSPFPGPNLALPYQHVHGEPDALVSHRPDVHPQLAELIARLMAKQPESRPDDAAEVFGVMAPLVAELAALEEELPTSPDLVAVAHGVPAATVDPTLPYTRVLRPRRAPEATLTASLAPTAVVPPPGAEDFAAAVGASGAALPAPAAPVDPPAEPVGETHQDAVSGPGPAEPPAALITPADGAAGGFDTEALQRITTLAEEGRYERAAELLDRLLKDRAEPATPDELLRLFDYSRRGGRLRQAYAGYTTLRTELEATRPATDPQVLAALAGRAACLRELGRTGEALEEYEDLLGRQDQAFGAASPEAFESRYAIAVLHAGAGSVAAALQSLESLRDDQQAALPADAPQHVLVATLITRLRRLARQG
ncbi:serine/threonine-protein kinase [Yinghuangia sp. ASG 101]|uniref:serine/threonine-protein kinase n=1 Tax=Yinghuangia sp. ASG 101 TaxID=2896848 RepID=UPI001E578BD7|nr:serine/threonine-protein kinase [Yinghuangia sp. ASG 101]UGQ11273.1 serine/threonine-protein kinase [Yinghuangia sp. ASG 101]